MEYIIDKYDFSNEGNRNDIRLRLVKLFSQEVPGEGNGNAASKYTYYVEKLKDGNRVYLRRPANLHNGFDFLVCVEGTNYAAEGERKRNYPKHDDIYVDLLNKKYNNPEEYKKLYSLLTKVYSCHDVTEDEINSVSFSVGLSVEHILKVIKWLFIEQDIRYWNYSGRAMTWEIVPEL